MLKIICGGALIVFTYSAQFAAIWEGQRAIEDLLAKRPELEDFIYYRSTGIEKRHEVERLYKLEFPSGKRIWKARIWNILGVLTFFPGIFLLAA
jgi:hypothetical protein